MSCIEDLAAAKLALGQLSRGEAVVKVQFEGEATDFTPANIAELRKHIYDLELECGGDGTGRMPLKPLGVFY